MALSVTEAPPATLAPERSKVYCAVSPRPERLLLAAQIGYTVLLPASPLAVGGLALTWVPAASLGLVGAVIGLAGIAVTAATIRAPRPLPAPVAGRAGIRGR